MRKSYRQRRIEYEAWKRTRLIGSVKAKRGIFNILVYLLGGLGSIALGFYLFHLANQSLYINISTLLIGGAFGLLGIASLLKVLEFNSLQFDGEKLIIGSILGGHQVIDKEVITAYSEIELEDKYEKMHHVLTIHCKKGKYKVASNDFSDYEEFRNRIAACIPRNMQLEEKFYTRYSLYFELILVFLGVLILWSTSDSYSGGEGVVNSNSLTTISGMQLNRSEIKSRRMRKSWKKEYWINIILVDYPEVDFNISRSAFEASSSEEYAVSVRAGDTVYLEILKTDYQKRVLKEKPLTIWDKLNYSNSVAAYGLRDKNRDYLTLRNYHKYYNQNNPLWLLCTGFVTGLLAFLVGLLLIARRFY